MYIMTNEWTHIREKRPPRGREVLVMLRDGRKEVYRWDGHSWCDQQTGVRLVWTPGNEPLWWYMFERHKEDYGGQ